MHKLFPTLAIAIILIVLTAIYFLFFAKNVVRWENIQPIDTTQTTVSKPVAPLRVAPEGFLEYHNIEYSFSLFYPKNLTIKEFNEEGGAYTLVFQDPKTVTGFQIFIVPFSGQQITEERFRRDSPLGVRKELRNTQIDGATAAEFYSTQLALGDTKEIWFIKGGYLYEVTTLKSLDVWLSQIMQSWKFF